ncbi:MAG: ion channel [Kofleriaceae bacterium]
MKRPDGVPKSAQGIPQAGYNMWIHGAERARLRDAYHLFLQARWPFALAVLGVGFFIVNLVFASIYMMVGGVDGVAHGSFFDALMFSVETLGTIGYGVMHPTSNAANTVVIVESITGIICTALITGLVYSKFARATARIAFSRNCCITKHEDKPTLMFRVGNERSNTIVEATVHVVCSVTIKDQDGKPFYKMIDLNLNRRRMAGMRRGWMVLHTIDADSPFHQITPELLKEKEIELIVTIMGFDDVTMQTVHAMYQYNDKEILVGHKFVDTLTTFPNGDIMFDVTKFHDTVPE